jgi:hypothetical protein
VCCFGREFGYKLFGDKEELDIHSYFGSMTDGTLVSAQNAGKILQI